MRYIGLIALFVLFMASCGNKKNTSGTHMPNSENIADITPGENDLIINQLEEVDQGDAYNILSAQIVGDSLQMTVSHGGGCKDHEYTLHSNGALMKSLPPKINVVMHHNGHEDYCRAMIQKKLSFNIAQLKNMSNGRIIINLAHFDQPLEYTY